MSGPGDLSDVPDGTALAAEYVLGLLEGEARAAAEARLAADDAFAAEVSAWWDRFSPLIEAVDDRSPPPGLWTRIEAAIEAAQARAAPPPPASPPPIGDAAASTPIVSPLAPDRTRRRDARKPERARRGVGSLLAAALMGALAASAATVAVMVYREQAAAPAPADATAPLLTAALTPEAGESLYVAAYDPVRRSVVVTPTRVLPEDDRARELWLIPADGVPRSAGLLRAGAEPTALPVRGELLELAIAGAALAVSLEPAGGSPTGAPTGPVIASGALVQAG